MEISVILAVYGAEKYIEECLLSLFNQTKTDGVEFILVNDCTPDNSMIVAQKVIAQYPNLSIKVINHEVNRGVAVARQTGVDASQGEYILHIDPDDWCEPNMLEEMYNAAIANDADILVTDYFVSYQNKEIKRTQSLPPHISNYMECLLQGADSYLWNRFIRRSLYIDNDVRFVSDLTIWEDFEIMVRLSYFARNVMYYPASYLHYRQTKVSITSTKSQKKVEQKIAVVDMIDKFLHSKKIQSQCADSLIQFKLTFKNYLLRFNRSKQREYLSLYKDVDDKVDTHFKARGIHKLALKHALAGRLVIFNCIYLILGVKSIFSSKFNNVVRYE